MSKTARIKGLRIKRKFLKEILEGNKNYEYRAFNDTYKKFFETRPSHLKLYDQTYSVLAEVKSIRVVKTPKSLGSNSGIKFPDKVYKIGLGLRRRLE